MLMFEAIPSEAVCDGGTEEGRGRGVHQVEEDWREGRPTDEAL